MRHITIISCSFLLFMIDINMQHRNNNRTRNKDIDMYFIFLSLNYSSLLWRSPVKNICLSNLNVKHTKCVITRIQDDLNHKSPSTIRNEFQHYIYLRSFIISLLSTNISLEVPFYGAFQPTFCMHLFFLCEQRHTIHLVLLNSIISTSNIISYKETVKLLIIWFPQFYYWDWLLSNM
jgi:hypothetical protein